eukprot:829853-Pyramimonas_sp.AAC.2
MLIERTSHAPCATGPAHGGFASCRPQRRFLTPRRSFNLGRSAVSKAPDRSTLGRRWRSTLNAGGGVAVGRHDENLA